MALMEWSSRFETGVPRIDRQHQSLVRQVNDLHDAMKEGRGAVQINSVLGFLRNYTVEHFRDEERYMEQIGFPGTEAHKAVHAAFLRRAGAWTAGPEANGTVLTLEIARALSEWLRRHILEEDQAYAAYAVRRGKVA